MYRMLWLEIKRISNEDVSFPHISLRLYMTPFVTGLKDAIQYTSMFYSEAAEVKKALIIYTIISTRRDLYPFYPEWDASNFCLDKHNNFIVSDSTSHCINVYSEDGVLIHTIGLEVMSNEAPFGGVAVNASGKIFISR